MFIKHKNLKELKITAGPNDMTSSRQIENIRNMSGGGLVKKTISTYNFADNLLRKQSTNISDLRSQLAGSESMSMSHVKKLNEESEESGKDFQIENHEDLEIDQHHYFKTDEEVTNLNSSHGVNFEAQVLTDYEKNRIFKILFWYENKKVYVGCCSYCGLIYVMNRMIFFI